MILAGMVKLSLKRCLHNIYGTSLQCHRFVTVSEFSLDRKFEPAFIFICKF